MSGSEGRGNDSDGRIRQQPPCVALGTDRTARGRLALNPPDTRAESTRAGFCGGVHFNDFRFGVAVAASLQRSTPSDRTQEPLFYIRREHH